MTRSSRPGPRAGLGDRLVVPLVAALVATVGLAFAAVWLQRPTGGVGSPTATAGGSNGPVSAAPSASPLPALVINGDLPSVTRVVVNAGGAYHVADLSKGTLERALLGGLSGPSKVAARPGGGWVCICAEWTAMSANGPGGARITISDVHADGTPGAQHDLRTLSGRANPSAPLTANAQLVDVSTTLSVDGRYAFVGWAARDGASWTAGVDIVDLASLDVLARVRAPLVEPQVQSGRPSVRVAPVASLSPDGRVLLMSSFWYVNDASTATPPSATDHWTAPFDGLSVGPLAAAGTSSSDVTWEYVQGMIDADHYYALRVYRSGAFNFDRMALDGAMMSQFDISEVGSGQEGGMLLARVNDALFIWNPVSTTLARVDLASGKVISSHGTTAVAPTNQVDVIDSVGQRLGAWLAPSSMAKTFLDPGIVASADGTRVYTIGAGLPAEVGGGSTGVFVFDVATLAQLDHWAPTADFVSIAASADGRYLYASGSPGVDADGHASANRASISVYDTSNGSIRLIAGQLGQTDLWFVSPNL